MARVLVIEDNPANRDLMVYLLAAFGHAPVSARDGEQGLEQARRERHDLILCDIHLPKMDGYAVARALKGDRSSPAPLVAITALAMVGDRDKVLAAGFDGYIAKPIDPENFVSQVESFLPPDAVSLPRTRARAGAVPAPAVSHGAVRATLLAVDNVPANLGLLRGIFEPLGYRVVTVQSAREALRLAETASPDLIISDLHMPDMDGYDFIGALKRHSRLRAVPFMFLTSTAWPSRHREKSAALGADKFISRPIEPQALIAEVEQCLRQKT